MRTRSEINRKGKAVSVPSVDIDGKTVIVEGRFLRVAAVYDEDWMAGQVIDDPDLVVRRLKAAHFKADIVTFSQKVPNTTPAYNYPFEWDNVAAIPLTTFDGWWINRLPQVTRKNVRRAGRRGVVVKAIQLNDDLIRGIVEVYGADPIRQGIPNAHYAKDFNTLKKEVSTFADTSEFIGAYHADELIGYLKLVYLGPIASIMNIVSKNAHQDKRPMNALLAKAVEIACQKEKSFLLYGKYRYGNKGHNPLAEFKRRNGFEQIDVPRYFVPLTTRGKLMMALRLHRGVLGILPANVIDFLLEARRRVYGWGVAQKLFFGRKFGPEAIEQA